MTIEPLGGSNTQISDGARVFIYSKFGWHRCLFTFIQSGYLVKALFAISDLGGIYKLTSLLMLGVIK